MRDRNRECVEIPVHHGTVRRRDFCVVLSDFSGHYGHAGAEHGAGCGPREPQIRGGGLPGAGAGGELVAYSRLFLHGGLLSADDVLHHGFRVDAGLFLEVSHRAVCRCGLRGRYRGGFHRDAGQSGRDDGVHGAHGGARLSGGRRRCAEGAGACDEGHDDRPDSADSGAGRPQPDAARRGGGTEILPDAEPCAGGGGRRHRTGDHRGHESGVLHAEPRRGGDGDIWKLYEPGADARRRGAQYLRA